MSDTPRTARRREREKRTLSQMIAIHCAGSHDVATRTERAHCGEAVCPECARLDAYAVARTERCRNMDVKTSCEECGNHCYRPDMREAVRAVMRYGRAAHADEAPRRRHPPLPGPLTPAVAARHNRVPTPA